MKYIDLKTPKSELLDFLRQNNWLNAEGEDILEIEKPGEGNMNVVLRIKTNERSFILKQSRPFVQKYQQIEAPLERIEVEYQFYTTINSKEIEANIPGIIAYDPKNHLLLMEDLGDCKDMTSIYEDRDIEDEEAEKLIHLLGIIHNKEAAKDYPPNLALRQLNHQHIFALPFMEDNGFNLDDVQEGLQELSLPYKKDDALKSVVKSLGKKYLSPGSTLIHGDYYPGSWMKKGDKVYIIDPEFSFVGFAEFDLGVMAAHLIITTLDDEYLATICNKYKGNVDKALVTKIAGVEIMRRLIGLAQLPLLRGIYEKDYLLQIARKMILT
ncbi:MAG: 5-methylthioribose kinase [Saprospiraceae bacterium]